MVVLKAGRIASSIQSALHTSEFEVMYVDGFKVAREIAIGTRPDFILIDIFAWEEKVESLLRDLVTHQSTRGSRKIILASIDRGDDSALALELGADDFILKPVSDCEFLAKIHAHLRTHRPLDFAAERAVGVLRLRWDKLQVLVRGDMRKLTVTEFNLLAFLMDHPAQVFSRDELLNALWLFSADVTSTRVIDVCVHRLRAKIEDDPTRPTRLVTVTGAGYTLCDPSGQPASQGH